MKANLTDKMIAALEPREKRYQVPVPEVRGLFVTVFPSGERSYYHYRKIKGVPQRKTLAKCSDMTLRDACAKASEINSGLASWKVNDFKGPSPVAEPRKDDPRTFGQLVDFYTERKIKIKHANDPARAVKAEKRLRYLVDPYLSDWKNRPLAAISKRDVIDKRDSILTKGKGRRPRTAGGKVQANHVVRCIRTLYYFAMDLEVADCPAKNPAARIKPETEKKRDVRIKMTSLSSS